MSQNEFERRTDRMRSHLRRTVRGVVGALWLTPGLLCAQVTASAPATSAVGEERQARIDTAVVNAHTFRLSISFAAAPRANPSMFIYTDPKRAPAAFQPVQEGSWRSIKSSAGELLVDGAAGSWMLKDAQGRTVIPATLIGKSGVNNGRPQVVCTMGAPAAPASAIYGSGDTAGGLLQNRGQSRVGNGRAGIPYYWSSAGYSVLALGEDDNAPANWQRDGASGVITWTVPGNSVELYLTPVARLDEACAAYTELTGRPPVPPRWTFGYLQSRWGWKDRAYIEDTATQFTERKLPVDAFIFDFEWYTPQPDYSLPPEGRPEYQDFLWNPVLFPEPAKQIADLHARGIHAVGIRKPRLGNSDLIAQFREKGWLLTLTRQGTDARCFDFSKPEVRAWYATQTLPLLKAGIDGWWDDEGERTYTLYSYWNQAQAAALAQIDPKRRLWTIDRAFQPGLQRYGAAAWTGDIRSDWRALAETPTRLLNWSMAGMYYGACDIGGFLGQDSPELLTRWMQAGVFFPVMRSHSTNAVQPRFPWLYGPQAEAAIRKALELRYRLIPIYYSLAHDAWERGAPVMRPLAMEFPNDPQVANLSSQWLIGGGIMAAPILSADNQRSVYFPEGDWYAFGTNKAQMGGRSADSSAGFDEIPVFIRAGTILPLAPVIQHTDDLPGGPLDLQIYPGRNATFTLIEDDGQTTGYTAGQVRRVTFTWDDAARNLSWKVDGPYRGKDIFKEMTVTLFDPAGLVTRNSPLESSGTMALRR